MTLAYYRPGTYIPGRYYGPSVDWWLNMHDILAKNWHALYQVYWCYRESADWQLNAHDILAQIWHNICQVGVYIDTTHTVNQYDSWLNMHDILAWHEYFLSNYMVLIRLNSSLLSNIRSIWIPDTRIFIRYIYISNSHVYEYSYVWYVRTYNMICAYRCAEESSGDCSYKSSPPPQQQR